MRHQFITKNRTFIGFVWGWGILLGVLLFFSTGLLNRDEDPAIWVARVIFAVVLVLIIAGLVRYYNQGRLKSRTAALAAFAAKQGFTLRPAADDKEHLKNIGALDELRDIRNAKVFNVIDGDDWVYCDFSYDVYRQNKNGEYKVATIYYGVMSTTLPRQLPHVFFDSRKSRRRQFRFHFARSQRHRLEGGFDRYFDTYFPRGYTIDSMSFISPDVMWELQAAADYDVEIIGNQLLLYGPLYAPEAQLPDMANKLKRIKKQLLDNILTYRDERLPYELGRQHVAALGAKLERSKFWTIVSAIVTAIFVILWIISEIYW